MKDLNDLITLWMEVFGVKNKVLSADLDISPSMTSKMIAGQKKITMERLEDIGRTTGTSLNTLLIAYMLLHSDEDDENRIPDIGDEIVGWLKSELAPHARDTETHSIARHLLGSAATINLAKRRIREHRLETRNGNGVHPHS